MKKRILTLLVCFSMVLSSICFVGIDAEAKSFSGLYSDRVNLLSKLGIITTVPEDEATKTEVSRGEFAQYLGKVLRVGELGESDVRYFLDVPSDHWALNEINKLTDLGIISISQDKRFRPDDIITANEALKMVVCAAGYGNLANVQGGYPTGYWAVGRRIGINVTATDKFTQKDAVNMLYEALTAEMYDQTEFRTEGTTGYESAGETMLYRYFDMYLMEGIVTYANGVAVDLKASIKDDSIVRIDEVEYKSDVELFNMVGMKKTFIVKDDKDTNDTIVLIQQSDEDDSLKIDIKDFDGYNTGVGQLNYFDEKGRAKSVKLSAAAVVVKNGKIYNRNTASAFSGIKKGWITLGDTNEDEKYDYALIYNYENIIFDSFNEDTGNIYDMITSKYVTVEPKNANKKVVIKNSAGITIERETLTKGDILSVYDSDNFAYIQVSTNKLDNEVFATKTDKVLNVQMGKNASDLTWYELDSDYEAYASTRNQLPTTGSKGTFYIDIHGKIVYVDYTVSGSWQYAYLVGIHSEGEWEPTKAKLLTKDGKLGVFEFDKIALIDGIRVTDFNSIKIALDKAKYAKTLATDEDAVNGQVIRVTLDADSKIKKIDTEYYNSGKEDNMSIKRTLALSDISGTWNYDINAYASNVLRGTNTIVFSVPKYAKMGNAADNQFMIHTDRSIEPASDLLAEAFKSDIYSGYDDVIVLYRDYDYYINPRSPIYMVGEERQVLGTDNEVLTEADFWTMEGLKRTYILDPDAGIDIETGDLLRISTNRLGYIGGVQLLYDYGTKATSNWANSNYSHSSLSVEYGNIMKGYIKYAVDGTYRVSYTRPTYPANPTNAEINAADFAAPTSITGVLVYDSTRKDDKIYMSDQSELITADKLPLDATPYLLFLKSGIFRGAIIYR